MTAAELVARLAGEGIDPTLLAEVAQELFAGEIERKALESRRKNERERKARSRSVTGQDGTDAEVTDKGSPDVSPQTPLPNPFKTAPLSPPKNRGTRLPADWKPNEIDVAFARSLGHTEGRVAAIAEQFRDHWLAAPGQRGVKLDWSATWRNWCRREGVQKDAPKYVSASGYEYRGGIEAVIREAERRGDMETYWKAKGDLKRAAA